MNNRNIEAARAFHAVTKHSYTSVRTSARFLDWDNRPMPYKLYPEISGVALPRDLALSRVPALRAVSDETPGASEDALTVEGLTRILFCADGLTRRRRVGGEDYHFRAAPSAGALYPVEVYTTVAEVGGLEPGLYHFSPADLRLRGLRRGDWRGFIARAAAGRASIQRARAIIVLSAIFWRSAWKYGARSYRYCFWDTGTILANLLAACAAEGLSTEIVTAFADPEIESLLGIDGEREGAICLITLGNSAAAPADEPQFLPLALETIPLSREEVSYPDLLHMHQESRLLDPSDVTAIAGAQMDSSHPPRSAIAIKPETADYSTGLNLAETILRRGSTRAFAHAPIGAAELATILAASSHHPRVDFPPLSETYVILNAVEGIEPGAYYYRRANGEFDLLKAGDFRGEAGYLCLEQPLGFDCSALVCYMANLDQVLKALGNRGYRDAHLEAGLHGGRAYLAAYALRRGATGLTFYDDDTTRFFAPHAAGMSPLLMVAIGVLRSPVD